MKNILFLIGLFGLFACNSQKQLTPAGKINEIENDCRTNFTCTIERLENKAILVKDYGTVGNHSIEIVDQPNSYVIHYKMIKTTRMPNVPDDVHEEEVFMELPSKKVKGTFQDDQITEFKTYYRRHCFCEGLAGYYLITHGNLELNHSKNHTDIHLTFKRSNPQYLKEIKAKVN